MNAATQTQYTKYYGTTPHTKKVYRVLLQVSSGISIDAKVYHFEFNTVLCYVVGMLAMPVFVILYFNYPNQLQVFYPL